MKTATIKLYKEILDKDIDSRTAKRVDATLDQASDRSQNAIASDATEKLDGRLIVRYRDLRDAQLRARLRFCLVKDTTTELSIDNVVRITPAYIYVLNVSDDFSMDDLQALSTKMNDYIIRGTLRDWYLNAGLQPVDDEDTLDELATDIASALRGKSYGHRPMQPFGPADFKYTWDGIGPQADNIDY